MTTPWQATTLSVTPPSYQMGHADHTAFAFNAGEAITGATAVLTDLATLTVPTGPTALVSVSGQIATVTVSSLVRGSTYELAVTFTRSDSTAWTHTLVIECVA